MGLVSHLIRVSLAAGVAAVTASAGTWIVDVNNGPGTNFTDLPPAIAAAAPGDVLLVRGGTYSPFTLSKGLTILGTPGAAPSGSQVGCCTASVFSVPANQVAVIADLRFTWGITVVSAGTVVMDGVTSTGIMNVAQSADVRLHRYVGSTTYASNSRFELSSSTVDGQQGSGIGGAGLPGLSVAGTSFGLISRSSCSGGAGADVPIGLPGNGGNGGHALEVTAGLAGGPPLPVVLIAGGGVSTIRGGRGGFTYFQMDGDDGDGLRNYKAGVWYSGATFFPGTTSGNGLDHRYVVGPGSFDIAISPRDPTLEMVGTPRAGTTVQLKVFATPGAVVRLNLGASAIRLPTPGVRVDKLVSADETLFLGVVPQNGVLPYTLYFRRAFTTGMTMYAQAFMSDAAAGETRRTNSVPIVMR